MGTRLQHVLLIAGAPRCVCRKIRIQGHWEIRTGLGGKFSYTLAVIPQVFLPPRTDCVVWELRVSTAIRWNTVLHLTTTWYTVFTKLVTDFGSLSQAIVWLGSAGNVTTFYHSKKVECGEWAWNRSLVLTFVFYICFGRNALISKYYFAHNLLSIISEVGNQRFRCLLSTLFMVRQMILRVKEQHSLET